MNTVNLEPWTDEDLSLESPSALSLEVTKPSASGLELSWALNLELMKPRASSFEPWALNWWSLKPQALNHLEPWALNWQSLKLRAWITLSPKLQASTHHEPWASSLKPRPSSMHTSGPPWWKPTLPNRWLYADVCMHKGCLRWHRESQTMEGDISL